MAEKKVIIEGTIKEDSAHAQPEKVVAPKATKKEALARGRSVYSTLGFSQLMAEIKDRGLGSKADGLTDSEKGRRELRNILKEDDAKKGVEAHLSESKTTTTETPKALPWWVWALVAGIVLIVLVVLVSPRQAATVDLSPVQASIDKLSQNVTDLNGRVAALEQVLAEAEETPVASSVGEPVKVVKVPDTVSHFYDLANFYVDGDPKVEGYKTKGVTMKYVCENSYGVFITMDPGSVNGQSTGDLGAVFFVSCKKGDVVTLTTSHWSESALHQQVHLVEFTQEITDEQSINFLKVLKVDEGKEVAFFIDDEGKITKY